MACFAATKWKRFLAPPTVCPLVSSQSCKYARYVIRTSTHARALLRVDIDRIYDAEQTSMVNPKHTLCLLNIT